MSLVSLRRVGQWYTLGKAANKHSIVKQEITKKAVATLMVFTLISLSNSRNTCSEKSMAQILHTQSYKIWILAGDFESNDDVVELLSSHFLPLEGMLFIFPRLFSLQI